MAKVFALVALLAVLACCAASARGVYFDRWMQLHLPNEERRERRSADDDRSAERALLRPYGGLLALHNIAKPYSYSSPWRARRSPPAEGRTRLRLRNARDGAFRFKNCFFSPIQCRLHAAMDG